MEQASQSCCVGAQYIALLEAENARLKAELTAAQEEALRCRAGIAKETLRRGADTLSPADLRRWLKRFRMAGRELGRRAGVSSPYMSQLCNGQRPISGKVADKLLLAMAAYESEKRALITA